MRHQISTSDEQSLFSWTCSMDPESQNPIIPESQTARPLPEASRPSEMLAERRPVEYEMQEMSASPNVETSLFAGLSFPEVPKTRIVIRDEHFPSPPIATPSVINTAEAEETETSSLLPPPAVVEEAPRRGARSLSVLYTPIEITSSSPDAYLYPELPNIVRRDAGAAPQVMAMQRAAPSVPIQQQTASSSSVAAVQAPAGESALVHELLAENSRLADEVQALRSQLLGSSAAAAASAQLQPVQAHPQPLQANPLHEQQQQQQQVGDAVTGVGISDPSTEAPAAGVKYVCCGHCRQWLRAHRDAVFVRCSQCDAVNNCSLAPVTGRSQESQQADALALQQQQQPSPFAFMDCLTKTFF